jgi:signal transduction histidine kinase
VKNEPLAQWLQDHNEMLGQSADPLDGAFHQALYEGLITVAMHGETRLVDSLLQNAAAQAATVDRSLTNLLGLPRRLRRQIWQRIGDEIDPEPAFAMLASVDAIFEHVAGVLIDAYQAAHPPAQTDLALETARLQAESEQKLMAYAAEVARANRELARLEKAKTDFISIAAHELKTPLTLIQGYVNILLDLEPGPQPAFYVNGIARGAERMGNILNNMLDLSALDTRQLKLVLEPVNLSSLVDLVIAQQADILAERKQAVAAVNLESLPRLEADQNRLHQILTHLVSNAIKYTPDGGQITVSARLADTGSVRLMVKDTGVGIAPENREAIFERFHRAGNSNLHSTGQSKFMGAGPGLGLAIVKGLVEAHGGRVWADSPGFDLQNCPGSTFNVVLPLKAAPEPDVGATRIVTKDET